MDELSPDDDLLDYYLKPVAHLFDLPGVTEVSVNNYKSIFIEQNGEKIKTDAAFDTEDQVTTAIEQIANYSGAPCDSFFHPIVHASLNSGHRVCGVLYPFSTGGSSLSIRIIPKVKLTLDDLIAYKTLTQEMADFLSLAVKLKMNILLSGATGSGKTTIINILTEFISNNIRVVVIEDTQEVKVHIDDVVYLLAVARDRDNFKEEISLASFISVAMRLNPDLIIVGEIKDADACDSFLQALITGHSAISSVHAKTPYDALVRIQALLSFKGQPVKFVESQLFSNLNIIIQAEYVPGTGRVITSISEIKDNEVVELWYWDFLNSTHVCNRDLLDNSLLYLEKKRKLLSS